MPKKSTKLPPIGTPLDDHAHPKDIPSGAIIRVGFHAAHPDCDRGTVVLTAGGVWVEMIPATAKKFAQAIQCAIECVERATEGKDGGR